ncbi:calmodulin-binding protein 60 A-like [Primulina eburnea]|uniref:calmodulin-binding protein 60 A-like n=1 Tax=Primulina eburnea TaxID=1245227 RepID=UPI003C6C58C0
MEIEGKGGTAMRLDVVDSTTGKIINSGPEASQKVEILLLQADDDNEHNWSTEDFNNKIIRKSEKEKPRVAKGMYVRLKEGVGILSDIKLGHGSSWKKRCLCRLGARFVDNSNGSKVKEAWTESFMVEDRRGKLYGKHYPPSLLDDIWRLENIGRDGGPCKDLYKENIITVQDFRFLLSIDR